MLTLLGVDNWLPVQETETIILIVGSIGVEDQDPYLWGLRSLSSDAIYFVAVTLLRF